MADEKPIPDFLLRLIEGCSMNLKIAIKFWIAITIFSLIIIISAENKNNEIKMPFELGELSNTDFYPLGFIIISVLIVSFGSALTQGTRAYALILTTVDELNADYVFPNGISLRDMADILIYPCLSRVSPLAGVLQRKITFSPISEDVSQIRIMISKVYYVLLKLVASIIMYFFPGFAMFISLRNGKLYELKPKLDIPALVFWIIGLIAFLILVQLLISEVKLLMLRLKILSNKS